MIVLNCERHKSLTCWFWYAVTVVNTVSGNTKVVAFDSSISRSVSSEAAKMRWMWVPHSVEGCGITQPLSEQSSHLVSRAPFPLQPPLAAPPTTRGRRGRCPPPRRRPSVARGLGGRTCASSAGTPALILQWSPATSLDCWSPEDDSSVYNSHVQHHREVLTLSLSKDTTPAVIQAWPLDGDSP